MSDPDLPYPLDPDSALSRYRYALGEFIHDFSWLETRLFDLLCTVAGVTEEIGQALFSGTRADQLISFIKRCYVAQELELEPYVARAFAQVSVINAARNKAVHFVTLGLEDSETEVFVTNRFRHLRRDWKDEAHTAEMLRAMAKDTRIISAILTVADSEAKEPGSTGKLLSEMRGKQRPWRYKPPS